MDVSNPRLLRDPFPPEPRHRNTAGKIIAAAIRRQRRAMAICLGVVLALGIGYFLFTPTLRETISVMHVEAADMSLPGMDATAGSMLAEQPQVMRSVPVIALAIAATSTHGLPMLQGSKRNIDFIQSNLTVHPSDKAGDYELTLVTANPADAEVFLNALVAAYIEFERSPQQADAALAAGLRDQREKADNDLAAARKGLAATTSSHNNNATADEAGRLNGEVERLAFVSDSLGEQSRRLERSLQNQVSISLVRAAQSRPAPVWPKPAPILGLSLLAGVLLGVAVALARDLSRVNLHDAEDAKDSAKAPILGRVPMMSNDLSTPALRGQCVFVKPAHPAGQALQGFRATLESTLVAGIDRTIFITGPDHAQGKSVVASNLAIAMARAGQRVALVDVHHRRPMVHCIFEIADRVGLNHAIKGTVKINDALHVTALHGLEVLPTGSGADDWSELLSRPEFLEALAELAERFDRVIIDGGPASADESRIIGAFCDATVLTVDPRRCRRRDLRMAADGLRAVGAKLAGIVLNDLPIHRLGLSAGAPRADQFKYAGQITIQYGGPLGTPIS